MNTSAHTHINSNLQIDDCIIQSASEVCYKVNDMSCLTSIAKIFNTNSNDHVIQVEIAYILMFFSSLLPSVSFFILEFCRVHVQWACVCVLLSQCELISIRRNEVNMSWRTEMCNSLRQKLNVFKHNEFYCFLWFSLPRIRERRGKIVEQIRFTAPTKSNRKCLQRREKSDYEFR